MTDDWPTDAGYMDGLMHAWDGPDDGPDAREVALMELEWARKEGQ